ncbi:MAG: hypothetical protein IJC16_08070 [Rikenellaceae bacterium]|nr:hypothetical protein [Rikenellaceae bacterium]
MATGDSDSPYARLYIPVRHRFTVRTDAIKGKRIKAWRYDPRTGKATPAGSFTNTGIQTFLPPDPGRTSRLDTGPRRRDPQVPGTGQDQIIVRSYLHGPLKADIGTTIRKGQHLRRA